MFNILSGKEQIIFLRDILKRLRIKELTTGMVLREISLAKNNLIDVAEFRELYGDDKTMQKVGDIYEAYDQEKQKRLLMDFDDLLLEVFRLLNENELVREKYRGTFRHLLVDEYQDTNKVQAEILYLLTDANKNIMVVGDDSQSIYAFRGANFRNILDFPSLFPGTRIIGLEENYRSAQPILDLTNVVIERAQEKYAKHLFTRKAGGSTPQLVEAEDENSQSLFIVLKIQELARRGVPLRRMAVLFRAGFHSFDLEIELAREGIPFIKVGGFKFTESAHIKDVLAHLRVIANPYDRISWHRILQLIEKVGPRSAQRIYDAIAAADAGVAGLFTIRPKHPGIERLAGLYQSIDPAVLRPAEIGAAVVQYYLPLLKQSFDDHPKRAKDLEQLLGILERYRRLDQFLTDMALEPPNISAEDRLVAGDVEEDRLVLSTIHSAKGLEWHSVFIIWALDGRFPSLYAMSKDDDMEEELRLMYVAATRAQENLFLTYPRQVYDRSLGIVLNRPSRFVDMIPRDILEKRSVRY